MVRLKFPFRLISKDNEKIFNRRGRPFMSAKFRAFHEQVYYEAKSQYTLPALEGSLDVAIVAYFHDRRHCDCSNLPKGCLDALQKVVYKNDGQIKHLAVSVIEDAPADHFEIFINKI